MAAGLVFGLSLAGCADGGPTGQVIEVEGFAGLVGADEPYAALMGRRVLGSGGSAADAALTVYFTMAVTLPSRAGLGGGGVCVVFDRDTKSAQVLEFLPRPTKGGGAVPGNPRGMAALHAQFGAQRWARLLRPAENLARFGYALSRAFIEDVKYAREQVLADRELSDLFLDDTGRAPLVGYKQTQLELSTTITGIRSEGAGYFASGPFATRFAAAPTEAGAEVTADELRAFTPVIRDPIVAPVGNHLAFFAPFPAVGGRESALLWSLLTDVESYGGSDTQQGALLLAWGAQSLAARNLTVGTGTTGTSSPFDQRDLDRLLAAYEPEAKPLPGTQPPRPASSKTAGLVVVDQWGNAVACNFTMNAIFGLGRTAPGTGLVMAAPQPTKEGGAAVSSPVIVANENTGDTFFAGTGGGGLTGGMALLTLMLETFERDEELATAMTMPRLQGLTGTGQVWVEAAVPGSTRSALENSGLRVRWVEVLGRAIAASCPRGVRARSGSCQAVSDPRGFGLARRVE